MKPMRLLITDDYLAAGKPVPAGYRKAYQIPATCANLYCVVPLNYVMIALHWLWQMWWKLQIWIPKQILYRGKWYDEETTVGRK